MILHTFESDDIAVKSCCLTFNFGKTLWQCDIWCLLRSSAQRARVQ